MKINIKTPIKLVAHITLNGLESMKRGQIDLQDPRLDGSLGTFLMELHSDEHTAQRVEIEIETARALYGAEVALHFLDREFIQSCRAMIAKVTSGDPEIDKFVQNQANLLGHELKVATN